MLFRKPCISSWDRSICPVTSQGAVCPPEHRQFQWGIGTGDCVLHLWTAGCTSTAEGTEVVVSTASSLFVFFPSVALSFLSLLWRTGQTEALFIQVSRAVLSPCVSWFLAQPSTRPLYFLVVSLNRPFYPQPLCHLPPPDPTVHRMLHLLGIIPIR